MEEAAFASMFNMLIRIIAIVVCASRANKINRSAWGWGIFALFLPIIAMIAVYVVKPVMIWEDDSKN